MTTSVFNKERDNLFTTYDVELTFRDKLLGGVPKDPEIIEGWLRAKAGIEDTEEIRRALLRTLVELGAEVRPDMSYEELREASKSLAAIRQTNGFKRDDKGLYIEDRQVKAMIKEAVNILYAGERWGQTRKGPQSFTAERVFVEPAHIHLGRQDPDGVETMISHLSGPKGPYSSIGYNEYVRHPVLHFSVISLRNELSPDKWPAIWVLAQENGLGADRSQSFGRFDVTKWEQRS